MATLEFSIEEVAVAPVRRTRRLGPLFWTAIVWLIFVFAAAALAGALPFSLFHRRNVRLTVAADQAQLIEFGMNAFRDHPTFADRQG